MGGRSLSIKTCEVLSRGTKVESILIVHLISEGISIARLRTLW